jgi:cysteine desulfuration protein SufE
MITKSSSSTLSADSSATLGTTLNVDSSMDSDVVLNSGQDGIQDEGQICERSSREAFLVKEFARFHSWEQKYRFILDLAHKLPPFPENKRTDDYKIKGCQSQVWLWVEPDDQGLLRIWADSDALITKGLVGLVLFLYSGLPSSEILNHSLDLFKQLGLFDNLSPSRANGFGNMIKQVKTYALAYQIKGDLS